jgi:hypothetical protein
MLGISQAPCFHEPTGGEAYVQFIGKRGRQAKGQGLPGKLLRVRWLRTYAADYPKGKGKGFGQGYGKDGFEGGFVYKGYDMGFGKGKDNWHGKGKGGDEGKGGMTLRLQFYRTLAQGLPEEPEQGQPSVT